MSTALYPFQCGVVKNSAAVVLEDSLLLACVRDAEHEHVGEPLARLAVDGVRPRAAMEAEELPVNRVRRSPVLDVLRRLGHRERELVEVLHRRHGLTLPGDARAGSASDVTVHASRMLRGALETMRMSIG